MRAASPVVSAGSQPTPGIALPATATDAEWKMIVGAVLMALALDRPRAAPPKSFRADLS